MKLRIITLLIVCAVILAAATTLNVNKFGETETLPAAIPTSSTVVFSVDTWVREIHVINTTGAPVTLTAINDQQSVPVALVPPSISIPANSDMVWEFTGRWAPGGIKWQAGATGLVGYIRGRQ